MFSIVWPNSGLALAILLLGGKRYWLGIFIGAIASSILAGNSISLSFIIACGNTSETLMGVFLLSRVNEFDNRLTQPLDYLHLILAGATSAWVSALIGNGALLAYQLTTIEKVMPNLFNWWLGDTLGIMLVTPFVLVWQQWSRDWLTKNGRLETIVCFGLAFLFGQAIFLDTFHDLTGKMLGYWLFLFIAWAAMRYEQQGVLLLTGMILIQGLLGSIHHKSFFYVNATQQTGLLSFTCYVLVLTTVGLGVALIIKKRQDVEQALRLSEQRLLTAQRIACLGNFEWNLTNNKVFWSEEMYHIFGLSAQLPPLSYIEFLDLVHADDRQSVVDTINNAIHLYRPYSMDYRIHSPKDDYAFLHVQAEIFTDEQGNIVMAGTVQDITERKLAEEALQLAALVYENSNEAMMITDKDDVIIAINPTFSMLTGYTEDDIIGKIQVFAVRAIRTMFSIRICALC